MTRHSFVHVVLLVGAVLFAFSAYAPRAQSAEDAPWRFIALGDLPYVTEDEPRYERLITAINELSPAPALTIHIGDIKSGGSPCSDDVIAKIRDSFGRFRAALIYTPGDNEWTDCHRPSAGGYDPMERLAKLREMFFSDQQSHGANPIALQVQAAGPRFASYVENRRWWHGSLLFATLHVVGSNNNLMGGRDAVLEYLDRNAANLAWLSETFAMARDVKAKGVVLAMQANPAFEERYEPNRSGFIDLLDALERETLAFSGQVLLIHGDSHRFRFDMPMTAHGSKRLVENFMRLEVFGDRDVHGVIVEVDPHASQMFSIRPLLVPSNVVDHGSSQRLPNAMR